MHPATLPPQAVPLISRLYTKQAGAMLLCPTTCHTNATSTQCCAPPTWLPQAVDEARFVRWEELCGEPQQAGLQRWVKALEHKSCDKRRWAARVQVCLADQLDRPGYTSALTTVSILHWQHLQRNFSTRQSLLCQPIASVLRVFHTMLYSGNSLIRTALGPHQVSSM